VHATFSLGQGYVDPARFWRENLTYDSPLSRHFVLLVLDNPWSPSFTFAAVDGGDAVSDAVGNAFDDVITGFTRGGFGVADLDRELDRWRRSAVGLDARVHVDDALPVVYPDQPFSVFNAD
jgi:hypothetical protein